MKSKYKDKLQKRRILAIILGLPETTPMPVIKKRIDGDTIIIGGKRVKVKND